MKKKLIKTFIDGAMEWEMGTDTKRKIKPDRERKVKPSVCVELKNGTVVCFGGTMDGMGCFVDLIGSGELKIKSVSLPLKPIKKKANPNTHE